MRCNHCNKTVLRKSKFCQHCGKPVEPRQSTRPSAEASKAPFFLFGGGMLIAGLLIGYLVASNNTTGETEHNHATNFKPQVASLLEIAQELDCPCGQCNHNLAECECEHPNGALEVKSFINQKLAEGHLKPHIKEMVHNRFARAILPKLPN